MIGLIFATGMEAKPFLALSAAEISESQPFRIFHTTQPDRFPVIISGIGKVAAALACQVLILRHGVTHVLNAGVCGSLNDAPQFGMCRLLRIESVVEGDHTVFGRRPEASAGSGRFGRGLHAARLVTTDQPVFDPTTRDTMALLGQVVDMEGAAIARAAATHGVPWDMIKGVSDQAGPLDRATLQRNLLQASQKIAQKIWQELGGASDG